MATKSQIRTLCAHYPFISTFSLAWLSNASTVCDELGLWVEAAAIIFASGRMLTSVVMRLKSSPQLLLEILLSCVLIQLF